MDEADVRTEGVEVYRRAGIKPDSPPGTLALAMGVFGHRNVRWIADLPVVSRLVHVANDRYQLHLRQGITHHQTQFGAAHELGEWRVEVGSWRTVALPWREQAASRIGAWLLVPDDAIRAVMHWNRWTPRDANIAYLARFFRTTETIVALRLGECYELPVAVLNTEELLVRRPWRVMLRGPWNRVPPLPWLDRIATQQRPRGWRKVRLSDEPCLVALFGVG